MTGAPRTLTAALRGLEKARARQDAALELVHEEMRQARRAGATVGQLQAWTGYSRRRVIQLTAGLKVRATSAGEPDGTNGGL